MGLSLDASIVLMALAPFAAALLAPLVQRIAAPFAGWVLALVPAAIFVFLLGFIEPIAARRFVQASIDWVPAYGLTLSFFIDGLSLTFALAISGIGTLILIYSGAYLRGHQHLGRFFGFMLAFMGAMLGLVLSDNMLALFSFWELTTVSSFLLIGFDHSRQAARRGAIQALVVTNIGGMGLLFGVILAQQLTGQWNLSGLRDFGDAMRENPVYPVVLIAFLAAAFTKSAQFPFHFWLPNAMEAPTPVSAFLHSATMVQGGVYLLLRLTPFLGGTPAWTVTLVVFGGFTLVWGALGAIRQTDLKQVLAQSTIASLGLLVLLIGLGTELAITAAILYFIAHAAYKAGLFMVVGNVDHGSGSRDIVALGGLGDPMPVTFIAAALAALSMIGLPVTAGFLAKEEMYLVLLGPDWPQILVLIMLVIGNALLAGVALSIAIRPFLGALLPTPKVPHEAPIAMLAGPVALGAAGILLALNAGRLGHDIVVPTIAAVLGVAAESHLTPAVDFTSLALWLSAATIALGILVHLQMAAIRSILRRIGTALGWTFDHGFDVAMFGLIRLAGAMTRLLHHGRLELYLVLVFAGFALAVLVPVFGMGGLEALLPNAELGDWSAKLAWPNLQIHEWAVLALAVVGLGAVLFARSRLVAILALGVQGAAVALIFLSFGAPDLAFTQFMVEILSVVILALVMTRLKLDEADHRQFEDLARDGTLAVVGGAGVSLLLMVVLAGTFDSRLSDFFAATSVPIAHGANIVNVILVDYRGFDTLGEISVVLGAGIAILALLRRRGAAP
ncbi:MAG: Na(+)/H(+) antiporter subunit [Devosia sp.]|uniref:hydrogen gas-evolving membrane-bound hydrogenase subunit E n=1 Tax=Devosia sp. TaxID=1871048 RepID=UPI00263500B6|nr:hydrogen gas-evolving membrane-bound hydrogenase subunit E [Devosia sp.]MDB5588264.1 Na(+)/H(+) antiporter subunit [Devosia sp.]